jgi:hypothetical protein
MTKKRIKLPSAPAISDATHEPAALTAKAGRSVVPFVDRVPTGQSGSARMVITSKGLALIERLAARGLTKSAIATHLGIHRQRLSEMLNEECESNRVLLACEKGHAAHESRLVAIIEEQAKAGYAAGAMFLLKTMHGFRENDTPQAATLAVQINLPQNMSREEFERQQKEG